MARLRETRRYAEFIDLKRMHSLSVSQKRVCRIGLAAMPGWADVKSAAAEIAFFAVDRS